VDEPEGGAGTCTFHPRFAWCAGGAASTNPEVFARLFSAYPIIDGGGLGDLPARTQDSRRAAYREVTIPVDFRVARDLVILWDDPSRLVFLDDGPYLPDVTREESDERGRAS
jgi:hypothetical protein